MNQFEKNGKLPLYKQIYLWMKDKILEGEWEQGTQIPPEPILSLDLGVSRQTVRQAMLLLINDGLIYRQPGKGTIVQHQKTNYQLSYLYSFSEQMREIGKTPSSQLLELENGWLPSEQIAKKLTLSAHDRVIKIVRLRLADGEPMSLEEVYMDMSLAPNLHKKNLESQSLYTVLETDYGLNFKYGDVVLGAAKANLEQAEVLKVEKDSPLVYLQCLTYLHNQRPGFLTIARYPYDRYFFTTSLPRRAEGD